MPYYKVIKLKKKEEKHFYLSYQSFILVFLLPFIFPDGFPHKSSPPRLPFSSSLNTQSLKMFKPLRMKLRATMERSTE